MAAPTYVANGAFNAFTGGSEPNQTLSIALPAGWQKGDIFVLVMSGGDFDQPRGWHQFMNGGDNSGGSISQFVWWRRATASETDPVVVHRGNPNERAGICFAIRGAAKRGKPYDVVTRGSGTTASWVLGGVTTTVADCLIVSIGSSGADNVTGQRMGAVTNANLTSLTERIDNWSATGNGVGIYVCTGVKASAGATGNTTGTNTAGDAWNYYTIAFKPEGTEDATEYSGPIFVAEGTPVDTAIATTITPGLPSGWRENDILWLLIAREGASDPAAPSGYTRVTGAPNSGYQLLWKRATASESAPNVVYSGSSPLGCLAQMFATRGCKTSGDPISDISSWTTDSTSDNLQNAPTVTSSVDMSLILHVVFNGLDNITGERQVKPMNGNLEDMEEFLDHWTSVSNGMGFAVFGGQKWVAGATGGGVIIQNNGAGSGQSSTNVGVTLALPPDDHAKASTSFQAHWID